MLQIIAAPAIAAACGFAGREPHDMRRRRSPSASATRRPTSPPPVGVSRNRMWRGCSASMQASTRAAAGFRRVAGECQPQLRSSAGGCDVLLARCLASAPTTAPAAASASMPRRAQQVAIVAAEAAILEIRHGEDEAGGSSMMMGCGCRWRRRSIHARGRLCRRSPARGCGVSADAARRWRDSSPRMPRRQPFARADRGASVCPVGSRPAAVRCAWRSSPLTAPPPAVRRYRPPRAAGPMTPSSMTAQLGQATASVRGTGFACMRPCGYRECAACRRCR